MSHSRFLSIAALCVLIVAAPAQSQTPAADVTPGTFGANGTAGNYAFPSGLSIGATLIPAGSSLYVNGKTYVAVTAPLLTGDNLVVSVGASLQRFGGGTSAPNLTFTAARGTETAPAASQQGDDTGRIGFRAWDGSGPVASARISGVIDGAVAAGSIPQSLSLRTGSTSSPTERMRIYSDGRVLIGNSGEDQAPGASRLAVITRAKNGGAFHAATYSTVTANETLSETAASAIAQQVISAGVQNSGLVIGQRTAGYLYGAGTVSTVYGLLADVQVYPGVANSGTITTAHSIVARLNDNSGEITTGVGLFIEDIRATNAYGIYQVATDDTNFLAGAVRIGAFPAVNTPGHGTKFYVNGAAHFDGTVTGTKIRAHYQDLAEWVPATADLAPGTVVVLNTARRNEVMASQAAYDTSVAGVVSEQPGISLGEEGPGKEQIATTGRVKVRVDARKAPIRVGDLLVTSDVAGTAMKSEPMDLNGRKFHQPGTIIGKALEPLEGGMGEILVLLSMQ